MKAQLGVRRVRPWKWMPFINPARKDGAVFHHWRRATDEVKEYPFAKFNKVAFASPFSWLILIVNLLLAPNNQAASAGQ